MKRYFLSLISLLIIFTLFIESCTIDDSDIESEEISKDSNIESEETSRFIYTVEGKKLVRYDVVERKEIVACPDPLCNHDTEDCLVSDIYLIRVTDDYIAYVKEKEDGLLYDLCLYDLSAGTIDVIMSDMSQIYYPWITTDNSYVIYDGAYLIFNEAGTESIGEFWYVYRYNIETKELETLNNGEEVIAGYSVVDEEDGRLIWHSLLDATYFSTDYDFENMESIESRCDIVGSYYFNGSIEWNDYDDFYRIVYLEDIKTGETTLISDNISEIRRDSNSSPKGLAYAMFDYNEEYGYNAKSEIWYFDLETMESRMLIDVKDISDEFDTFRITSHEGYDDYASGYMMISIGHTVIKTDKDGDEYMSANYTHNLFINPETGDWFIMGKLY